MSELITFNAPWLVPVIIAVIVTLLLIAKELYRQNKKSKLLRIVTSITAVFALLIIFLQPSLKQLSNAKPSVTLTAGYDLQLLDSLTKSLQTDNIAHYDSMSYKDKLGWFNEGNTLIIGNGIPTYDLPLWKSVNARFIESSKPLYGIQDLCFDQNRRVGEALKIRGSYFAKDSVKLILNTYSSATDSIDLPPGSQEFSLVAPMKASGKYVFYLEEHSQNEKINHPIPVVIEEPQVYKIMMVNAFPTFELKYLKNYLAEEGHQLTVRNQLTAGRYKFEFYNHQGSRFYSLTDEVLEKYDLIVLDQPTLDQLTVKELKALNKSIKKGNGLLLLSDEKTFTKPSGINNFSYRPLNDNEIEIKLLGADYTLDSYGYSIDDGVLISTQHSAMVGARRNALGKIGVSTFKNTYQLVLKGELEAYKFLWSSTITPLLLSEADVMLELQWPLIVDEPVDLRAKGIDSITHWYLNGTSIAPRQDMHIPTHWQGIYWPDSAGWQRSIINADTSWLYVCDANAYKTLRAIETRNENLMAFGASELKNQERYHLQSINLTWFYLLFLLSAGYLWLEPKLS